MKINQRITSQAINELQIPREGGEQHMNTQEEVLSNLILELRRGTLVLSVLSQLSKPQYGYSLVQSLEDKGLLLDAGTLYPLLRRLETQDLLISEWETSGTKPRKYYSLSENGKKTYKLLCDEWTKISDNMNKLITE
jgi:PadR family transcriptional regulator PadR